jgi:hypothetical protein
MGLRYREDDLLALREQKEREAAMQSAVALIFAHFAQQGLIDDRIISDHAVLFDFWDEKCFLHAGCIRRCPEDGRVYRFIREPDPKLPLPIEPPSMIAELWQKIE